MRLPRTLLRVLKELSVLRKKYCLLYWEASLEGSEGQVGESTPEANDWLKRAPKSLVNPKNIIEKQSNGIIIKSTFLLSSVSNWASY